MEKVCAHSSCLCQQRQCHKIKESCERERAMKCSRQMGDIWDATLAMERAETLKTTRTVDRDFVPSQGSVTSIKDSIATYNSSP